MPHPLGRLWAMGEAGGGPPGNSPSNPDLTGTEETLVAFGAARGG